MKRIEISDADYELLMELSKELQTQENHHQAFPYFWEPMSKKLVANLRNEGVEASYYKDGEVYSLSGLAESFEEDWEKYLIDSGTEMTIVSAHQLREYDEVKDAEGWEEYVYDNLNVEKFTQDWEDQSDHNPSLFLSDVKEFIKYNKHHLGREPHTYARTIWRMSKMTKLIEIIYRLNPQPKEKTNPECERIVRIK